MTYEKAHRQLAAAVAASQLANDPEKARAKEAMAALGKSSDPDRAFVYNAFLSLLARGVAATEANILAESKALFRASETFHKGRRKPNPAERAA